MEYENEIQQLINRVDNVLKYIEENPKSDPNAYEMMELTIDVGEIGAKIKSYGIGPERNQNVEQGYNYAANHEQLTTLRKKYFDMMDIRLQQMKNDSNNLGLDENSPLYVFLSNKMDTIMSYSSIAKGKDKEMLCKLAAIGLYQKQQQRDLGQPNTTQPIYSQISELEYYYKGQKTIPEAELEMLNEIQCLFMSKETALDRLGIKSVDSKNSPETIAESSESQPISKGTQCFFNIYAKICSKTSR